MLRFPDASDSAAALRRALDLRQELLDGAPFEEVARRESADSASGVKGGELGELSRGDRAPAFEQAAFSLAIGKVSEPVLTQDGYHLIRVDSRTGAKVRARHILLPVEITGQHRDVLDARADSLELIGADQLDPAALDTAARVLGLTVGQANPLQKGGRVQVGFQVVPDAGVWAFQAQRGETSRIVEVPYAFFLFRLDSLRPEGVPPFETIQGAVELAAREERKMVLARQVADDLAQRVREGSTLAQAAQAVRAQYQQVGPFTRIRPPFPESKVIGAAFGLVPSKPGPVVDQHRRLLPDAGDQAGGRRLGGVPARLRPVPDHSSPARPAGPGAELPRRTAAGRQGGGLPGADLPDRRPGRGQPAAAAQLSRGRSARGPSPRTAAVTALVHPVRRDYYCDSRFGSLPLPLPCAGGALFRPSS